MLDTGADHCVFPITVTEEVGAELFTDSTETAKGIGGEEIRIVPGRVEVELLDDDDSLTWTAVLGFANFEVPEDECSILGHASCFEHFRAEFDGMAKIVELLPRGDWPPPI